MKLTKDQIEQVRQDLLTIARQFNAFRCQTAKYLTSEGINPKSKEMDPFFLYEGGSELTKQFHKDWQLAAKMAICKGLLSVMEYVHSDVSGFNLIICKEPVEEISKAFLWVPGQPVPNKWTGNKYSQNKIDYTLMLSFGCNYDGTIKRLWAAIAPLTHDANGVDGDWTFSAKSDNNAFSTLLLTKEIFARETYQQVCGDVDIEYGAYGEPKKGMQLLSENLAAPVEFKMQKSELFNSSFMG